MRRSGRTTRQVDEAVQTLFTTGEVVWCDHAASEKNSPKKGWIQFQDGWIQLVNRLWHEHQLSKDTLSIDHKTWTLKLKQHGD